VQAGPENTDLAGSRDNSVAGALRQHSKAELDTLTRRRMHTITTSMINLLEVELNDEYTETYHETLTRVREEGRQLSRGIMLVLYARQLLELRKRALHGEEEARLRQEIDYARLLCTVAHADAWFITDLFDLALVYHIFLRLCREIRQAPGGKPSESQRAQLTRTHALLGRRLELSPSAEVFIQHYADRDIRSFVQERASERRQAANPRENGAESA